MQCRQHIRINPARHLAFSPRWDNHSVIFDSRSGDFWIVDNDIADALSTAMTKPAIEDTNPSGQLQLTPDTIENLVSHGIIELSGTS